MQREHLYCFEDVQKRFFKIGVTSYIDTRTKGYGHLYKLKPLFYLTYSPKHLDTSTAVSKNRDVFMVDTLNIDVRAHVFQRETLFKRKFKGKIYSGKEFVIWTPEDIAYTRRLFKKLEQSDRTALMDVRFTEVDFQEASIKSEGQVFNLAL